ncbi:amyloid fiber anchoring/assembly protein TapA [Mesobacillus zeae]|uniref:amyloid fiber anchoring/assembly protein TapA n=1 Tax=Mesobacillus zeae TaxID=1917180 RepID=UPI0015E672B7|nr:amyloid fiber anchoring/assembly protein TapA [Mesobacillus zeae]
MRNKDGGRIKKFGKKKRTGGMAARLLGVFYALMLTVVLLTTNTGAYFNDASEVSGSIQAGEWREEWDKSSLKFVNDSVDQTVNSCSPAEILAEVKNTGSNMTGPTEYEVYYAKTGNPKKGTKVGDGTINPINASQTGVLKFMATNPGNYKFKAFQRPGHGNNYDSRQELWSETITVKCTKEAPAPAETPAKETEETEPPKPQQPSEKPETEKPVGQQPATPPVPEENKPEQSEQPAAGSGDEKSLPAENETLTPKEEAAPASSDGR